MLWQTQFIVVGVFIAALPGFLHGADESPTVDQASLFALYPVAEEGEANTKGYWFEHAFKTTNADDFSSGIYRLDAVVDFSHVSAIRIKVVERSAAPFTGIVISFTDDGYRRLAEYLETEGAVDLVLSFDGHVYSAVDLATVTGLAKDKGNLIVFIAEAYSKIGNHLIHLLVEKLERHLAARTKPAGEAAR